MKKIVPLLLILTLALSFAGCSGEKINSADETYSDFTLSEIPVPAIHGKTDGSSEYVIGDRIEGGKMIAGGEIPMGSGDAGYDPEKGTQYASGTLTCAEHSDLAALDDFKALFETNQVWKSEAEVYKSYARNSFAVSVTCADGAPAFNIPVELLNGQEGETVCSARTDVNGRAVLTVPGNYAGNREQLLVRVGGVSRPVTEESVFEVENGNAVQSLDLMFMIDTTGSMSDELEYLKVEFRNVIQRICQSAPEGTVFSVRTSVNFYRDEGDEYVLRPFAFTGDVNSSLADLSAQFADGGGDYPEAVHTALASVIDHDWREDAVKLCFLVLDAPCHTDSEVQGVSASINRSLSQAAEKGIRIIPVASSGVSESAEMLFRSYAVQTNGTYIFLTNHSGIGGDHKDPTGIRDYEIELLNDCMVRVVREFCGLAGDD